MYEMMSQMPGVRPLEGTIHVPNCPWQPCRRSIIRSVSMCFHHPGLFLGEKRIPAITYSRTTLSDLNPCMFGFSLCPYCVQGISHPKTSYQCKAPRHHSHPPWPMSLMCQRKYRSHCFVHSAQQAVSLFCLVSLVFVAQGHNTLQTTHQNTVSRK